MHHRHLPNNCHCKRRGKRQEGGEEEERGEKEKKEGEGWDWGVTESYRGGGEVTKSYFPLKRRRKAN